MVRPDGEARLIASRCKTFYNLGNVIVIGVFIDISESQAMGIKAS